MLIQAVDNAKLDQTLVTQADFRPLPTWDNRQAWATLDVKSKTFYMETADALRGYAWPSLPAARYMDFARNGNRTQYETLYFQRRDALFALTLAECITGSHQYLDDIINGIWCVCEESTWVLPAHNNPFSSHHRADLNALADIASRPHIDLFVAETASLLAWVFYLLKSQLNQESPIIAKRITEEIQR
ncbi:MAG: heparinase, partial [Firmicutes bacterium]|nr:heparinase [Bacillota bacterium]